MPPGCRVCPQPQAGLATLLPGEGNVGPAGSSAQELRTQAKAEGQSSCGAPGREVGGDPVLGRGCTHPPSEQEGLMRPTWAPARPVPVTATTPQSGGRKVAGTCCNREQRAQPQDGSRGGSEAGGRRAPMLMVTQMHTHMLHASVLPH